MLKVLPQIPKVHNSQFIPPIFPIGQKVWDILKKRPYRVSLVRGLDNIFNIGPWPYLSLRRPR
jgi:hypothetical protein